MPFTDRTLTCSDSRVRISYFCQDCGARHQEKREHTRQLHTFSVQDPQREQR